MENLGRQEYVGIREPQALMEMQGQMVRTEQMVSLVLRD